MKESIDICDSEKVDCRLEALKLAFEMAFKAEIFYKRQTPEERYAELVSIFEVADLNYRYIVAGELLEEKEAPSS